MGLPTPARYGASSAVGQPFGTRLQSMRAQTEKRGTTPQIFQALLRVSCLKVSSASRSELPRQPTIWSGRIRARSAQ